VPGSRTGPEGPPSGVPRPVVVGTRRRPRSGAGMCRAAAVGGHANEAAPTRTTTTRVSGRVDNPVLCLRCVRWVVELRRPSGSRRTAGRPWISRARGLETWRPGSVPYHLAVGTWDKD
jgi:hypothetical protein